MSNDSDSKQGRWFRFRLPGASEDVVSLGPKVAVWFQQRVTRRSDPSSLKTLKAVDEHGPVDRRRGRLVWRRSTERSRKRAPRTHVLLELG